MKIKFLVPVFFTVLAACNGGSETTPPTDGEPPQEDRYLQGQIDALEELELLIEEIDSEKDTLNVQKKCSCNPVTGEIKGMDHLTGQAHVHQDKLVYLDDKQRPLRGLLTIYDSATRNNPVICNMYFLNTRLKVLAPCQHISDESGKPAFKTFCYKGKVVAYRLQPAQVSPPHTHNSPCHP